MFNITKADNGFELNSLSYKFDGDFYKISDKQVHVPTDNGNILLDLSITIEGKLFDNIDDFINDLYADLTV